jgi:hypothetical protein
MKRSKPEPSTTNEPTLTLHRSDNSPITIKKSDVRLVQAEQVTCVVLNDGSEAFVRETPEEIAAQMQQ